MLFDLSALAFGQLLYSTLRRSTNECGHYDFTRNAVTTLIVVPHLPVRSSTQHSLAVSRPFNLIVT